MNWIGKQIGKCRIEERIGVGGMGTVYKAKHLMLDKIVALKVLHRELIMEDTGQIIIRRFLREARSAARLEHPNIVTIHDVGEENGIYYIVMQYVEGETLLNAIERQENFSVYEVLRLAKEIAKGLAVAHHQGIIHRDIKPANIMISSNGEVKITDFGMAREVNDDSGISQSGRVFGTPLYLSPEQARGEKKLDGKADIYALGCTIYHAMTSAPPYSGKNAFLIMQQHVYSPLPAICKNFPYVPGEVEYFVHKLMAKKREERFASAEEVIGFIEQLENKYFAEGFFRPQLPFPHTQKKIPEQQRKKREGQVRKRLAPPVKGSITPDASGLRGTSGIKPVDVPAKPEIAIFPAQKIVPDRGQPPFPSDGEAGPTLGKDEAGPREQTGSPPPADVAKDEAGPREQADNSAPTHAGCPSDAADEISSMLFTPDGEDARLFALEVVQEQLGKDNQLSEKKVQDFSGTEPKTDEIPRQNWRRGLLSPREWIFLLLFVAGCLILFWIFVFSV